VIESVFRGDCKVPDMRSDALSIVFMVLLTLGATPIVATGTVATGDTGSPATEGVATDSLPSLDSERYGLQPTSREDQTTTQQFGTESTPSTTFRINLRSDRSADWVVTIKYGLSGDDERESFREIASQFEAGANEVGPDISLYENIATRSSEHTDREMSIENVDRSSTLHGDVGTLSLSFTWTEFLEENDEELVFNETLKTSEENAWLTSLSENQELRITTPQGYAITSANVGFSDNTVVVTGPHTFDPDNHVQITLEPSLGPSWGLIGAAVVIGVAIIGGALLLRRQDTTGETTGTANANGGVDSLETSPTEPATDRGAGPAEPAAESDESSEEDLSLLADDERVLRLLERNGGRMRQAKIVSETKWSDAKVSQLLSSMADDDEITKLRIGRENLISLPEIDALDGSPVEDDENN